MKARLIILLILLTTSLAQVQAQRQDSANTIVPVKLTFLKNYTGSYSLRNDLIIEVTLEDGFLYFQAPGEDRKVKLLPKSESRFFNEINSAEIQFNSNKEAQVMSLTVINEVGRKITAAKR